MLKHTLHLKIFGRCVSDNCYNRYKAKRPKPYVHYGKLMMRRSYKRACLANGSTLALTYTCCPASQEQVGLGKLLRTQKRQISGLRSKSLHPGSLKISFVYCKERIHMLKSTIFKKTYDGESLYDLDRDIGEAFIEDYNPKMKGIPSDEYGFHRGSFVVTVVWVPDEEGDENA